MKKSCSRLLSVVATGVVLFITSTSAHANTANEIAYQQIVNSDNPESEIFLHSLRHLRVRTTAQKFLRDFDAELDEQLKTKSSNTDLFAHPSYVRLLAARKIKEQEEHLLEYALERAQDNRKQVSVAKALTLAIQNFNRPLLSSDQIDTAMISEIEASVGEIQKHLIEPFYKKRSPNNEGSGRKDVYPDSGDAGFISGKEFTRDRWALTFDDGPSEEHTPVIVDNLRAFGMKASFFWLAKNSDQYPDAIEKTKSAGMIIGNHSFHHVLLTKVNSVELNEEINHAQTQLTKDLGFAPRFFRCPYGACGAEGSKIRQAVADQNMVSVIWNIDSLDWQDHNPKTVYERVKKQMELRGHGIILFHDVHPQSVVASKMIMGDLAKGVKNKTTRVLTVEQAVVELGSSGGMK